MKQSTKVSFFFFAIALFLELISTMNPLSGVRLFVGVFIVLGLAFLVYSFQIFTDNPGHVLLEDGKLDNEKVIKPTQGEFFLKQNTQYLWIENASYLNWRNFTPLWKFLLGIAATIGGEKAERNKKTFTLFKIDNDSYVNEASMDEVLKSSNFEIVKEGDAYSYYSNASLYGMVGSIFTASVLILLLVIYILLQIV